MIVKSKKTELWRTERTDFEFSPDIFMSGENYTSRRKTAALENVEVQIFRNDISVYK